LQCFECNHFHWHNPRTAINAIPFGVQVAFACRQTSDAGDSTGLSCPTEGCRNAGNNQPRKVNTLCERRPKLCSKCCKGIGGCKVHKLGPRDQLPTQQSLSTSATPTPEASGPSNVDTLTAPAHILNSESTRNTQPPSAGPSRVATSTQHYARPLNEMYARAYVHQHKQRYATEQQIEDDRQVALVKANTIQAQLWMQVCFHFCFTVMSY
jgi:hypothetical protein